MGMQSDIFAEEMRGEIAAVDGIELGEATEVPGFRGWFLGLSLTAKSKLSTGITVVGMTLLATAGLVGIFNPGLSGVMATIIVVILAVTLIAGFVSLQMILKEVIAPFTHVASEMGRLAGGARDIDVGDTTRPDEIGDLSRALSIFAKSGIKLDELFAGRRTALERRKHELMLLADRFEQSIGEVVGGVAAASSQLNSTAGAMAGAAEQAAGQASQVSHAMEQASGGVTAAAAADAMIEE